jgi:hypothetical protein
MQAINKLQGKALLVCFLLLCAGFLASAQNQERMTIQATARGTSTQLGKLYNINIHIEQFSTPDDQKALIEGFNRSGQNGLVDVLEKMKPKGRIRFASGGVGNDIKHIIELPSENGRRFRLVTDRNLAFGELYYSSRSSDYSVGAIELTITPDGKGTGTLLPACKLKLNKEKQIEIEAFQNPWDLNNFMITKD